MAIRGRSFPLRAITIIRGIKPFDALGLSLDAFTTSSSFPALSVTVPNATAAMDAFTTSSSFPTLTVAAGFSQAVGLPAFTTVSVFPYLRVDVPLVPGARLTGVDGEVQWRDTVWTPGSVYTPIGLEGWDDLPGTTSGDQDKPQDHGAWSGITLAESRVVSVTIWVRDDSPTWKTTLKALRNATPIPIDETQYPLAIQTRDEQLMAWAKIKNRVVPQDSIGIGTSQVSLQWVCTDPRRYGLDEYQVNLAAGQTVGIANDGDAPTSPTLIFPGPAVLPRVQTPTQTLAFNVTLGDGETLTVDTRLGTAEWSTGDYAPTDDFSVPIEMFQIAADGQDVTYAPDAGGTAGMTIAWRYATW